ncbi:MAG: IS200/IS605 family transposase [Flavobacteriales bacterium]|nr:IS200/IS605 family transposase [Flavobacteriales bacterium]MCB9446927.1 IS200/IS605 family transposase [Flavobacteriales bacterium]
MSTYSQIYIQIVFAVKHRDALIRPEWEERLYQYMTAVIQNKGQKMIAINGIPDHIHLFIGMKPTCCLSDLIREVKKVSTLFINERGFTKSKFQWQEGFGAFSYGHSQIDQVTRYVMRQKEHHRKITFYQEYMDFLEKFQVTYDEKYLFDPTE